MTQATVRKGITLITLNDSTSVTWANGIVAVTAYGVIESITVPLLFEVYNPKNDPTDIYRSKPEIAAGMIRELKAMGFRFKLVLADSLYGESGCGFINV